MTKDTTQWINETTEGLLKALGIEGEVFLKKIDGDRPTVMIQIKTPESRLLIGQYGANLSAFQHLLRVMIYRGIEQDVSLLVDVNDYREQKQQAVEQIARRAMEKVKATRQLVILKPMTPFERRVVHTAIAADGDLMSESLGEEPNRRVVVKLKRERKSLDEVSEDIHL